MKKQNFIAILTKEGQVELLKSELFQQQKEALINVVSNVPIFIEEDMLEGVKTILLAYLNGNLPTMMHPILVSWAKNMDWGKDPSESMMEKAIPLFTLKIEKKNLSIFEKKVKKIFTKFIYDIWKMG